MNTIHVLDCTLRDGGYCNQWNFGESNIKKILSGLTDSGIEIVECGFITDKVKYDSNRTKYPDVESISPFLPKVGHNTIYVAMVNYGEYDIGKIPDHRADLIDGIRVAFHKKNIDGALKQCELLIKKGYKVFIQAMVTMAYSDIDYLDLISKVNNIRPYAFYIVDSFGMMKKRDLIRYYSLAEKNLDKEILIGFHSHNNLQLAYSNALSLIDLHFGRNLIIDSTIYGMGRGAGNLNTELFIDCLNNEFEQNYNLKSILNLMDDVVNVFYQQNPWGYSLPNYLSAVHNAHPNYAGYLSDKHSLTIDMMDDIFARMDPEKKVEYNKEYIEKVYNDYMDAGEVRKQHREDFRQKVEGKTVLLIAPGKSSTLEKELIKDYQKNNSVVTISVNFSYHYVKTDYIFVSNNIRFKEIPISDRSKCIITSNIPDDEAYLQEKYTDLLNDNEFVKGNAGLMIAKMLIMFGVKKLVLAGFDGYSYDVIDNYAEGQRILVTKKATIDATNKGMEVIFKDYSKNVELQFLTRPQYFSIN